MTANAFSQEFQFALVGGKSDNLPKPHSMPWPEFVSALQKPEVRSAKDGPGFIPANFRELRREDRCIEYLTALVLDLDGKTQPITREQIATLLDGYTFVAHTTFSSTPENLRWRVVIPYTRPATVVEHQRAYEHMQQVFEGAIDPACKNPSRFFYGPACPHGMEPHFQCFSSEGVTLDPSQFTTAGEVQAHPSSGITISMNELRVTEDIKQLIREGKPKGRRSEATCCSVTQRAT
ncbi:hypothetical protein SAMN04515620_102111 [Collimonas sp. OK607]|uniref:hypothetical protein n=1 Tax=Collimonas sp. OK607 TaxID=1798194 RepID=UPI0008E56A95|nr:hypothetical protein [Collimonas sp. OK607]SFA75066.1 hypothetical protein SAMN04515620_102111 [Collimonas sp. OK607]